MATRSPVNTHSYWGIFQSAAFLPNVLGSPTQSNTLQEGDQAWSSADSTFYVCIDATVGAAVWSAITPGSNTAPVTRSYGDTTLLFPGSVPPFDASQALDNAFRSGGHVDLIRSFDAQYSRCLVRLRVVSSSVLVASTTQRFSSLASIVSWVNANTPISLGQFAASVFMTVYDEIDGNIHPPAKVYGKNRLWAGLVSRAPRGYYWQPRTKSCEYGAVGSTSVVQARADALNGIWSALYPSSPLPSTSSWTASEFGLFWITGIRRSRYDMPTFRPAGLGIYPSGNGRYFWNGSVPVPAAGGFYQYNSSAADTCAYSVFAAGAPSFAYSFGSSGAFRLLGRSILSGMSAIVGYPLIGSGGELAVNIRPVGVDQWYFDSFDESRYRLEAVGSTRHNERPKLRNFPVTVFPDNRTTGAVDASSFNECFGGGLYDQNLNPGRHGKSTGIVQFQYRDLDTGLVSPLSSPRIVPVARRRARPFSLMVVNFSPV